MLVGSQDETLGCKLTIVFVDLLSNKRHQQHNNTSSVGICFKNILLWNGVQE
jgi:hypothetical protein